MESVCFAIVITVLKHGVFFKTFFITSRTSDCRKVKFYIRRVKNGARNVLFSVGGVKRFLKEKEILLSSVESNHSNYFISLDISRPFYSLVRFTYLYDKNFSLGCLIDFERSF